MNNYSTFHQNYNNFLESLPENCRLDPEHYEEFKASGISDEIIRDNFRSVSGSEIFEILYGDIAERLNTGKLNTKWQRKYEKCLGGRGWIDYTGRFKQTSGPALSTNEKGKAAKYLSPSGKGARCFFPQSPDIDWDEIRTNESIPITLTEGGKKAAFLASLEIIAIGIPGISMGWRSDKENNSRSLREELQWLDTPNRQLTILFDYRSGDYLQSPEFKNACIFASCFQNARVKIGCLPGPEKGVDDYGMIDLKTAKERIENIISNARFYRDILDENLWRRFKSFTPDIKINQRFIDCAIPDSGIVAIKSGLGTGKTVLMGKETSNQEGRFFNIGYRNSLLLQQSERWGFKHLYADNALNYVDDDNAKISLCLDSLTHIPSPYFEDSTLILDESCSIVKHGLNSKTLSDKRLAILEQFRTACQSARRIICLDGHNTDQILNYIKSLCPDKKITKIENTYQQETPTLTLFNGEKKGYLQVILNHVMQSLKSVAIATDSIKLAETYQKRLEENGKKTILLCSKTVNSQEVRRFLKNPDDYLVSQSIDTLIYTPTAESGLDISIKDYFSDVYGIFRGVIGVDEIVQMIRRVRHPKHIWIHCKKRGFKNFSNCNFAKEIINNLTERCVVESHLLADEDLRETFIKSILEQASLPHFDPLAKDGIKRNLESSHLREYLILALKDSGFTIDYADLSQSDDSEYKAASEEIKLKECSDIFNAKDISIAESYEIRRNFSSTWEDRAAAIKANYLNLFPGIEKTPLWTIDLIYRLRFSERNLISQLRNFWTLNNPDEAKKLRASKWKDPNDLIFLSDINPNWLKIQTLSKLGIEKFFADGSWHKESEDLLDFQKQCSGKAAKSLLGSIGKLPPVKFINKLLSFFGATLKGSQVRDGDRRYRVYDSLSFPGLWCDLYELFNLYMIEKLEKLEMAEHLDGATIESVTEGADFYKNNAAPVTRGWGWIVNQGKLIAAKGIEMVGSMLKVQIVGEWGRIQEHLITPDSFKMSPREFGSA